MTHPGAFFIALMRTPVPLCVDNDDQVIANIGARQYLVEPDPPETAQELRILDVVRSAFHAFYLEHGAGEEQAQLMLGRRSYVRLCCAIGERWLLDGFNKCPITLDAAGDPDRVLVQHRDASRAFAALVDR